MNSQFPQIAVSLIEGGGTMPHCDEDSELRFWFREDAEIHIAEPRVPTA